MDVLIILLLVGVVSLVLSLFLASRFSPFTIHDSPNTRSLHEIPTPRTGGIAILSGIALGWTFLYYHGYWNNYLVWVIFAVLLVSAISILDDYIDLLPLPRLVVHGISGTLLMVGGDILNENIFVILSVWLAIVWVLNLYNFMDGMDGLAAGMAVFGFSVFGIAGWIHGDLLYAYMAWAVAIAALGFLVMNFPPAKIFMGDVGSIPLGLLVGAFSLWGIKDELFPIWLPVLTFSPFIIDATITILRRLIRGEKIWHAHRCHYYQRLVLAGWGHKGTALAEYFLMLSCGLTALFALQLRSNVQWAIVLAWGIIYLVIIILIEKRIGNNTKLIS